MSIEKRTSFRGGGNVCGWNSKIQECMRCAGTGPPGFNVPIAVNIKLVLMVLRST